MSQTDSQSTELTDHAADAAAEHCVNCGAGLASAFCAHCGEKRASDRRYTLLQFGGELLENFAQLDGTVWRTLKTLVTRPGELTAAYMRGQRIRYMKPLQLFVLVSVVYFFTTGFLHVHTFDVPLRVEAASFTGPARRVERRLAERKIAFDEYAAQFDATGTAQAKTLVIVMVPAFSLLLALVEIRKRRFALEHLVFGLHVYAALLIVSMALDASVLPLLRAMQRAGDATIGSHSEGIVIGILGLAVLAYLVLALGRTYADRPAAAVAKAVTLLFGMTIILFFYRVLLFYTTFWAT